MIILLKKVFILHFLFRTTIYTQKLGYFSLSFLKKGGVICKFSTALKGGSKTQLFSFISTK